MLKYEVTDLSQVDEALRGCYAKIETGAYRLQISGHQTKEELRAGLAAEKAATAAATAKIKQLQALAAEAEQRQAKQEREDAQRRAEREAQLSAEYERKHAQKLAEYVAGMEAQVASLRADRERVTLGRVSHELAAKLIRPGCDAMLLIPHIAARLEGREENGAFVVGVKDAASLDELAEQFRTDNRFERIIIGASPIEKARHAARVAETLGVKAGAATHHAQSV
jgi:hypothetical protein